MKVKVSKQKNSWICDSCGKEKDTLYFVGEKQICEECKEAARRGDGHTDKD